MVRAIVDEGLTGKRDARPDAHRVVARMAVIGGGVGVRTAPQSMNPEHKCRHSGRPDRTDTAQRWIETHENAPASIDALAAEVATSAFHFLRIFDQVIGVTSGQYLLRRRLHRAATRLRGSGETVAAVALESGFDDLSTFNRQFQRAFGLTPSAYRARRAATL